MMFSIRNVGDNDNLWGFCCLFGVYSLRVVLLFFCVWVVGVNNFVSSGVDGFGWFVLG